MSQKSTTFAALFRDSHRRSADGEPTVKAYVPVKTSPKMTHFCITNTILYIIYIIYILTPFLWQK